MRDVENAIYILVLSDRLLRSPIRDWYNSLFFEPSMGLSSSLEKIAFLWSGVGFLLASVSPSLVRCFDNSAF